MSVYPFMIWEVFCVIGVPIIAYAYDRYRLPGLTRLGELVFKDEYDPKDMIKATQYGLDTELGLTIIWFIGGFGTVLWWLFTIAHYITYKHGKKILAQTIFNYAVVKTYHKDGTCTDRTKIGYCPFCSGEWYEC